MSNNLMDDILRAEQEEHNESTEEHSKSKVPIWEKATMTLEEAAAYSSIGVHKLRAITNNHDCPFVLWNGTRRLIKRKLFDQYLERSRVL